MNIKSVLPSFLGKNIYDFILIDKKTNRVKQKVTSYNLITNDFWNNQQKEVRVDGWGHVYGQEIAPRGLSLGSGKGTPSETDTHLFSKLWSMEYPNSIDRKLSEDKKAGSVVMKYIFPANASYIGTITEAGLTMREHGSVLASHCMLKDAEGNPLSIEKTANDKLEVVVTVSIRLQDSNDFKFIPLNKGHISSLYFQMGTNYDGHFYADGLFYSTTMGLLRNRQPKYYSIDYNTDYGLGKTNASKTYDIKKLIFHTQRMEAAVGNNHYYFCLSINGIGYYTLPNEKIFPSYNITKINIGVGDGETLSFKNPLNYFKKNTDIIYINGQPKKRNVDYTIDSDNNFDMLNELSAGNWIKEIYSEADDKNQKPNLYGSFPFFSCSEGGRYAGLCDEDLTGKYLKLNIPMYIELEELKKINTCYIRNVSFGSSASYSADISIKLEYSQNGQEYKEAFTSDVFNSKTGKCFKFDTIEALYWKMTLLSTSGDQEGFAWINGAVDGIYPFLGYVGDDKITFKVPPAKDDIITMDVKMDIPFKNENYSIDTSATLEFI